MYAASKPINFSLSRRHDKLNRLLQNCCRVVSKNEFTRIQILPFTLKALANSSPGLRFGNPGKKSRKRIVATLKELLRFLLATRDATPSESRLKNWNALFPRVAKARPWGGISQRLQRSSFSSTQHLMLDCYLSMVEKLLSQDK